MKIEPYKYNYKVCPYCNSKKLMPVGLVFFEVKQYCKLDIDVQKSGCFCSSCKRYHTNNQLKWKCDRAEMRRDANRLLKFLKKGKK